MTGFKKYLNETYYTAYPSFSEVEDDISLESSKELVKDIYLASKDTDAQKQFIKDVSENWDGVDLSSDKEIIAALLEDDLVDILNHYYNNIPEASEIIGEWIEDNYEGTTEEDTDAAYDAWKDENI